MKKFAAIALVILGAFVTSRAQDVFTITPGACTTCTLSGVVETFYRHPHVLPTDFSPDPCNPYDGNVYCSVLTYWPEACPPGLNCDKQQGNIELIASPSGIGVPWYLNYPNGGDLWQDCALYYNPIQFNLRPDGTTSDGTKVGDTWYFTGSTVNPDPVANPNGISSCSGYALGVSYSVTTNWSTTSITHGIGRGGAYTIYTYRLSGGSGVASHQ
jgi:hypothetical protein